MIDDGARDRRADEGAGLSEIGGISKPETTQEEQMHEPQSPRTKLQQCSPAERFRICRQPLHCDQASINEIKLIHTHRQDTGGGLVQHRRS